MTPLLMDSNIKADKRKGTNMISAVSYTHLDVYKRQVILYALLSIVESYVVKGRFGS